MTDSRGRSKERSSPTTPVVLGQTVVKRVWTPGPTQILNNFRYSGTLGYKREAVAYEVNEGPPYKTGGPFKLLRYELIRSQHPFNKDVKTVVNPSYYNSSEYRFTEYGDFSALGLPNTFTSNELNSRYNSVGFPATPLANYSEEALNKINPTNISKANLALSLAELWREGLPSIPGVQSLKRKLRGGSTGGEYLNVEFGWKPVVAEVLNTIKAFEDSVKIYNQLVRDNGRKVRRRATVYRGESKSLVTSNIVRCYPVAWNPRAPLNRQSTAETRLSTRVWTVGRGSYFIPDIRTEAFKDRLKQEILGARPNLALLYELMPWSWMIDWVSNVGEVIQYHLGPQVSEFVIDYAYLMRHVQKDVTYTMSPYETDSFMNGSSFGAVPGLSARERFETKERIAATPFGFGITLSSLSAKQWAILAALGISKARF